MKTDGRSVQPRVGAVQRNAHVARIEQQWPRPRDLQVLRWACEQYAARLDHVEAVAACSRPVARQIMVRLREAGFVRTRRYVVGEPMWVLPTRSGLRAGGTEGRAWIPSVGRLAHLAAINDVRLHIQRQRPDVEWIAERRLRSEHPNARREAVHLPDGVAILEGRPIAIEVELHYKGPRATEATLHELARRYDTTLYYCDRVVYRRLAKLEQSGRWARLEVRAAHPSCSRGRRQPSPRPPPFRRLPCPAPPATVGLRR
jgi:hypothetical protein